MKTFHVNYFSGGKRTHGYDENWEVTALFCPSCGRRSVWRDAGPGDVEVGPKHICLSCFRGFYIPDQPTDEINDVQGKQRIAALIS